MYLEMFCFFVAFACLLLELSVLCELHCIDDVAIVSTIGLWGVYPEVLRALPQILE